MKCPCPFPCDDVSVNARIAVMAKATRLRTGERVWTMGDRADGALIVCRGAVTVSSFTPSGQEQVGCVGSRGMAIGLDEVIDGGARRTEVEVVMAGHGLYLSEATLLELLDGGGAPALTVAQLAVRRVRAMGRRVAELGYGTVEQRIGRLIVRMCDESGLADERGVFLPLQISRVRLAVILGCRTETLVRVLKMPALQEILTFTREGILVRDMGALRMLASSE